MRTTIVILASAMLMAGSAYAENATCTTTPCQPPSAAPGGTGGSGPSAIRNAPMDSPVGTGAGGGGADAAGGGKGSNGAAK